MRCACASLGSGGHWECSIKQSPELLGILELLYTYQMASELHNIILGMEWLELQRNVVEQCNASNNVTYPLSSWATLKERLFSWSGKGYLLAARFRGYLWTSAGVKQLRDLHNCIRIPKMYISGYIFASRTVNVEEMWTYLY